MKSEDLFEALTELDDDLIYKAKAAQLKDNGTEEYAEPTFITVTKRKFPWKAAACAALAVIIAASAGVLALKNIDFDLSSLQWGNGGTVNPLNSAEYPEKASYTVDMLSTEETNFIKKPSEVNGSYDSYNLCYYLEQNSDLIVYGTFTDDSHQLFDPSYPLETAVFPFPESDLISYNKFKIEKLFKGDGTVSEGDEIIISQNYAVCADRAVFTSSGLTPMIKGEQWCYFLTKDETTGTYSATGDTDGRYYSFDLPPQSFDSNLIDVPGLYDSKDYKQNIHKLVYDRYLNESFEPNIEQINYLDEESVSDLFDRTEIFELPEFPEVYFTWNAYELKAVRGNAEETLLYGGMPIWDLHLADLNGDGKRELCSTVSIGSGIVDNRIIAADYANNEVYQLEDRGYYDYSISADITEDQNNSSGRQDLYYTQREYNSYGSNVSEEQGGVLTLDIMEKLASVNEKTPVSITNTECILDLNGGDNTVGWNETFTFTMPEFKAEFKWVNSEKLEAAANGKTFTLFTGNPIWDIYLCDLNGDGKREICSSITADAEGTDRRIEVFDYENGELYELSDSGNYNYMIDWGFSMLSSQPTPLDYKKMFVNGATAEFANGEPTERGILSLDIMKKIATVVIDSENIDAAAYEFPAEGAAVSETTALEQAYTLKNETKDGTFDPENFKIYEPFGMVYDPNTECLYYNGKKVRWFQDYYPIDENGNPGVTNHINEAGIEAGSANIVGMDYINETGVVDVYAVRDFSDLKHNPDGSYDPSGKLVGLKEFSEEEFAARDIKALLHDKEVTQVASYDDDRAVETDSGENIAFSDDQITVIASRGGTTVHFNEPVAEASENSIHSTEDILRARAEHVKMEEEYKPFGVTYDKNEDQWYFNGEKVRYFRDILTSNGESLSGGNFHGSIRTMSGKGTVDIYTVRDFTNPDKDGIGKLTDIKAFKEGEIDLDAEMEES